jgi:hypothetical protein
MAVTSTPSHDDAVDFVITPAMLEAARPKELRRLEDTDSHAVFAFRLDLDEDDLLLDCFVAATGIFYSEDVFEGAELFILIAHDGQSVEWRVEGPHIEDEIARRYAQPTDTANAIRFLEDYMMLGIRLPYTPARLSDIIEVRNGALSLNARPMSLEYPADARPVDFEPDPTGNSMGWLAYENSQGALSRAAIDNIVLKHR